MYIGGAGVWKSDRMIPQDRLSPLKKFWQMWYHFLHPWPLSFKSINISPLQIHIHKDGKTFGPYPLKQVRQYLKTGNFTGNDLACHDGANWIKLSQVPGIAPA